MEQPLDNDLAKNKNLKMKLEHTRTCCSSSGPGGLTKNGIRPRCQSFNTILETVDRSGSPPYTTAGRQQSEQVCGTLNHSRMFDQSISSVGFCDVVSSPSGVSQFSTPASPGSPEQKSSWGSDRSSEYTPAWPVPGPLRCVPRDS